MASEVIWSPKAEETFDKIIEYLQKNWTEKEVVNFANRTNKIINIIRLNNVSFRRSEKKDIYEIPITKHNILLYRIHKNHIELLRFYDTRQNPKKKFR